MLKFCLIPITIILLLTDINVIHCFISIVPVVDRMACKFNDRFINATYTFHQPESITDQSVSFEFEMVRELKEMKMTLAYYAVYNNGSTVKSIAKRTVDFCTYLKRTTADRLVKVVFDHMKRNNRFPTGCPIPSHERFYLRHIRPSAIRIPSFLPESSFIFDTNYYTGVLFEPMVEVRYYGRLVRV